MYYTSRATFSRWSGQSFAFKGASTGNFTTRRRFRYEPLNRLKNEIRLLTVSPVSRDNPEEIRCSLIHSSLDSTTEYHALSYAWRDDKRASPEESSNPTEQIIIGDDQLRVGRNLAAALRARRSQGFGNVPLWVDAICINQDETAERNGQILRMRNIYARASKVTVWLGPEREDSQKAFEFIRMIYGRSKELGGSSGNWAKDSAAFSAWFKKSLTSRRYSSEWRAVYLLLRRTWWKRIWIVQEMIAAKQAEFFCGASTLDPSVLAGFLDLLVAHGVMYLPLLSRTEGIILEYAAFALARAYLHQETWKDVPLLQALYRTGMALSSEPRDKIYAVLNLARDGGAIVPKPDYSLSIETIYKQLVVSLVTETGRLDILSLATLPVYPRKLDINLPSWVPDWTYRVTNTINSSIGDVKPVWTDNNTKAAVTFDDNGNIMRARGFIIDTVDGLSHCIGGSYRGPDNYLLHKSTSQSNIYGNEVVDAIWRSLVADLIPAGVENYQEARSLFVGQCRDPDHGPISATNLYTFRNWYHLNQEMTVAGRSIKDWVDSSSVLSTETGPDDEKVDFGSYRLTSHWESRRLITTSKGYVGLGPRTSMIDDKVCIFLGCCTPIILREVEGHYEVVGEGYIHGVMHGEAMIDLDSGMYDLEDFEVW